MKLRNKKTGEIVEYNPTLERWNGSIKDIKYYISLAELNEDWEDYEEPKYFWFIDDEGGVIRGVIEFEENLNLMKQIGNYFETKEEAEKAVEKLKAWKRLKDKGFDIEGWNNDISDNYYKTGQIVINLNNVKNRDWDEYDNIGEIKADLDLLFGGEE